MHGVVAKRRAMHFGRSYEYESARVGAAPPVPEFLFPLRERIAGFTKCSPAELAEVLITEYPAGAGIGWHRDAPAFDFIVGISLLSECTMKFRPWPPTRAPRRSEIGVFIARTAFVICSSWACAHPLATPHPADEAPEIFDHFPNLARRARLRVLAVILLMQRGPEANVQREAHSARDHSATKRRTPVQTEIEPMSSLVSLIGDE